ncbi:MAG TPA: response regulator [Symbiobacteriaceae bacterium]|jgi:CheY-like chemotaxis protein
MNKPPVLIVEDNPSNLKLLKVLLTAEGYEVRTAIDAQEALAVLADFLPRLIFMDIQLPGIDGCELTRRIKADPRLAAIKVIAVTAYAMKGDEEIALAAGCDAYVPKPINTRELPHLVRKYLGGA